MNRRDILLIEDNVDARETLALLLENHGYAVRSAESGAQGLEEARRKRPDLVITDVEMPDISGLDVLEQFRQSPELDDMPVIVVSGRADVKARIAGFDLGADDFLPKPVEIDELLARVRRQLLRSDREREVVRQSIVDALTGVLNRRGIENFFAREYERASADSTTVAVMMVDLNEFKRVNDDWGHAAGDTVLCATAHELQDALRANDRIGRMGGDEFVIVLPNVRAEDCEALAQRVRRISPILIEHPPAASLRVGLSLGIASAAPGEALEAVLARADAAMYEDKRRQKLGRELLS